jgi:uncharacterized protein (TIRG00374 family)
VRSRRRRLTIWLGVALAAACLVSFARGARWGEIGGILAAANVPLILAASSCLLMTSVARAWRWHYLLREQPVTFRHRLTSTLIGFAGNNVLPGRLGEPLRCWAVSRLDGRLGFWQAAGSIVVERVFDLAAAVVLLLAFVWVASSGLGGVVRDASVLGRLEQHMATAALVVLVVAIGIGFAARASFAGSGRGRWAARIAASVASLQRGLGGLTSVRTFACAVFFTVVLWTAMLAFELLMLWAFGFRELGLAHALGLLVVLSFAIAVPQAPAGVGVVQLASETTLTALFGMPVDRAKAFAIGLWVCQVAVVVGAGAVALWIEGLSLAELRGMRNDMESAQATRSE